MNQRNAIGLSALAVVYLFIGRVQAADRSPKIQKVIDRGVSFLRSKQNQDGSWTYYGGDRTAVTNVGATALAAWSLLECRLKPDDPIIRRAADFLRQQVPGLRHTYSLSASIWFFDRLGDKN